MAWLYPMTSTSLLATAPPWPTLYRCCSSAPPTASAKPSAPNGPATSPATATWSSSKTAAAASTPRATSTSSVTRPPTATTQSNGSQPSLGATARSAPSAPLTPAGPRPARQPSTRPTSPARYPPWLAGTPTPAPYDRAVPSSCALWRGPSGTQPSTQTNDSRQTPAQRKP